MVVQPPSRTRGTHLVHVTRLDTILIGLTLGFVVSTPNSLLVGSAFRIRGQGCSAFPTYNRHFNRIYIFNTHTLT